MTGYDEIIDPRGIVDLWHEDSSPNAIWLRQNVREEWPELGRALDQAIPSSADNEQPAGEPTIRVTNEGAVFIGIFALFIGVGVGMALQFAMFARLDTL